MLFHCCFYDSVWYLDVLEYFLDIFKYFEYIFK